MDLCINVVMLGCGMERIEIILTMMSFLCKSYIQFGDFSCFSFIITVARGRRLRKKEGNPGAYVQIARTKAERILYKRNGQFK